MRPTAATLRGGSCCHVGVMAARGECAHPTWHHRHATAANQAWGPHPDSEPGCRRMPVPACDARLSEQVLAVAPLL